MRSKLLGRLLLMAVCALVLVVAPTFAQDTPSNRIHVNNQDLFLSGINLAWINFARDVSNFDEPRFVAALDELQAAKGNTLRWWLHTNGATSPIYGEDGMVSGLGPNDIENIQRALDLAYERGILIDLCLWSHDMMNNQEGVPTDFNKLMIEDPDYTQAYIDNALTPLVTALAGHPGIAAWEIFNEPEGVTEEFGWTDQRTDMAHIQQFVNLLAGAIHRADPDTPVTNGSWNLRASTDVGGFHNYYTDERLIEAGGDPDGTLDFYSVHYYPNWEGEATSPFHNPYSYWELDKPLVVGEFPAAGLRDLGMGYVPRRQLPYSIHTYPYLFENGYAGALSWAYTDNDFGGMLDASSGTLRLANIIDPEAVTLDISNIDHIPVILSAIDSIVIPFDTTELVDAVDLSTIFSDVEDGSNLTYSLTGNSRSDLVVPIITSNNIVRLNVLGSIGTSVIEITATDSGGHSSRIEFAVQVVDPNTGNVAVGKSTIQSTDESTAYAANFATDGLLDTRSSTEYADDQWLVVDLDGVFTISQVILRWEAAFGQQYDIEVWDGSAWQVVYHEPISDGAVDDITLPEPVDTRYVRIHYLVRGTQWGFSLWEFEINGIRNESGDAALEAAAPPELTAAAEAPEEAAQASTEVTATQLYGFEADAEGWGIVDFWTAITTLDHSTDMASDGSGSIAVSGAFSGTQWEEGGVFIALPEGTDWSAYAVLTVDVYVPEGADGFLSQVYLKTGADFTWANTSDFALTAGQWNTLTADLSTLGDLTDVREVGLKIGTSSTAFEGTFYIDNIGVGVVTEAAAPEETAVETQTTQLNSFEADAEGWGIVDFWTAITTLDHSTEMANDGSASIAVSGAFSGTQWEEGGVFIALPEGTDWSAYSVLNVDVYVPEGADNFISQVYMKTGADFTWANTADFPLTAGQWNTLTADLSTLGDLTDVREVGLKIGTSSTAFEGTFYIDNVSLVSVVAAVREETAAEPVGELTATALYSYEADVEGWGIVDFWTAITTLDHSTDMASDGSGSIAVSGAFSGTQWEEGGIFIALPEGTDWSAYDQLTVDIFVPEGAGSFISQVYMKTGADFTWANTPDIQLIPGEWNTLTADLSALGDLTDVREVGLKIGTSVTPFEGTFYIDNVQVLGD